MKPKILHNQIQNVNFGSNVTVLPGIYIGEDAIIGAGSIVTKDVESGVILFGNPATPYKAVYS